ncbi:hypothetical protein GGR50DRAFT_691019 [Xylaria sp. CBS 124048]|nr:hypothetical protein GGR50DRAFT_691019 [Xylaria sp. CBS 124048]
MESKSVLLRSLLNHQFFNWTSPLLSHLKSKIKSKSKSRSKSRSDKNKSPSQQKKNKKKSKSKTKEPEPEPEAKQTILITGLNGYLAGRTAELVLREGYRVRGTVRNRTSGEAVKTALCRLGFPAEDIDVVEVPDMCRQEDLDSAAKGCTAIFHLAAPMSSIWTLPPSEIIRISTESITAILNAAQNTGPTMKSVVFLSSTAAVFDLPLESRLYAEHDWNRASELIFAEKGDLETGGFHAYLASKTKAEKLFWRFRDEKQPSFSMTTLQPTYFIGPPLIPWNSPHDIPYSNQNIWAVVSGQDIPGPMQIYSDTIDIRDVARMLLWSVTHRADADGQRFVCSSAVGGGQAIADILAARMPHLQTRRGRPGHDYSPDFRPQDGVAGFDSGKALAATGWAWMPYEQSVVDMARFLHHEYIIKPGKVCF